MKSRYICRAGACFALFALACSEVAPTNPFDPATPTVNRAKTSFSGVVFRAPCKGGEASPAANVTITPERDGEDFPSLPSGEDGTYTVEGLVEGEYLLRFSLDRHVTTTRVAIGRAGEVTRLDPITLVPVKASLTGTVGLGDGVGGGTTVIVRADPGDLTIAGTERVVVTTPSTGEFRIDDLCPGVYAVAAVAEGYRTLPFDDITVGDEEPAEFSATLTPRSHAMSAPAETNGALTLTFEGDDDLTHVRAWVGPEQAPDGLAWSPLPDGRSIELMLPSEGRHTVYAELATQAASDDDTSNDLFAYVSGRLTATSLLDQTAPVVASIAHEPEEGANTNFALYAPGDEAPSATLVLSALDPMPSSTIESIIMTTEDADDPVEKPFSLRTTMDLPRQGENTVYVRLKDKAGNISAEPGTKVVIFRDDSAPIPTAIEGCENSCADDEECTDRCAQGVMLTSPAITSERTVQFALAAIDPDTETRETSGLEYRVGIVGFQNLATVRWTPMADAGPTMISVNLPDQDGTYDVQLVVRDQVGRIWTSGTVATPVTLDRRLPPPIEVSGQLVGRDDPIQNGDIVRLANGVDTEAYQGPYALAFEVAVPDFEEGLNIVCVEGCADDASTRCTLADGIAKCTLPAIELNARGFPATWVEAFKFETRDRADNVSAQFNFAFTVDHQPPLLSAVRHQPKLGQPEGFIQLVDGSATIELEVSGYDPSPTGGLSAVRIQQVVDGTPSDDRVVEHAYAPTVTYTVDEPGWHTISVRVADAAGNLSSAKDLVLFADKAAPLAAQFDDSADGPSGVKLVSPAADQPITNRLTATIAINVSDVDAAPYQTRIDEPLGQFGPTGLRYRVGLGSVDGSPWRPVPTVCAGAPCPDSAFEHQVVLPDEEQLHQIAVQVIDASGRYWQLAEGQSVATVNVTVDRSIARPYDALAVIPEACPLNTRLADCERRQEWASGAMVSFAQAERRREIGLRVRVADTDEAIDACVGRCSGDDNLRCTIKADDDPDAQGFLSCIIDGFPVPEQIDELRVPIVTQDQAGNVSTTYTFEMTIDNDAPSLLALNHEPSPGGKIGYLAMEKEACDSPAPEYVNAEPVVTLDLTAIDGGGSDRLQSIHVASYPVCTTADDCTTGVCLAGACRTPCAACDSGPLDTCIEGACLGRNLLDTIRYRPRIQVPAREPGKRKFIVHVADAAGNWSLPADVTITRDEFCPTGSMTLTTPPRTYSTAAKMSITLDDLDPVPGTLEYSVVVNGQQQAWQEALARTFEADFSLSSEAGEQTIGLMVRDEAGHVTTLVQTLSVILDQSPIQPTSITGRYGNQAPFENNAVIAIQPDRDVLCTPLAAENEVDSKMAYTVTINNSGQERVTVCHRECSKNEVGDEVSEHCIIEPDQDSCTIDGIDPPSVLREVISPEAKDFELRDEAGNVTRATFEFNVDHSAPRDFEAQIISRSVADPLTNQPIVGVSTVQLLVESSDATAYTVNDWILDDTGMLVSSASMNANLEPASFDALGLQTATVGITPTDGQKTINVCFTDDVENCDCKPINLRLDTQPPAFNVGLYTRDDEAITIDGGGPARIDDPFIKVRVQLDPSVDEPDCASFEDQSCGLYQRVSYDPSFAGAVWARAQPEVELNLPVVTSDRTIYVQLKDQVGNASDVTELDVKLELQLDIDGPDVPGMTRTYIGPEKIRLAITPPDDPDLSYYVVERNIPAEDGAYWERIRLTPAIADDGSKTASSQTLPTSCQAQARNCDGPATCLRKLPGVEQILVEDRNVNVGLIHQYRVRALDDLGNESAVSVPVYGGVPMEPTRLEITSLGNGRTVSWAPADGTFQVEQVLYTRRTLSGDLLTNEAIPPGQGSFNLKPLIDADTNQFVRESVTLRTSNADRSIIWETMLSGLGVSAIPIDSLTETTNLKSVELSIEVDSAGTLHTLESVTTDETFHRSPSALVYRKIAENGQSEAYYYATLTLDDGTSQGAIKPGNIELALNADGEAYAAFFTAQSNQFVLAKLTPPVNGQLTGAVSLAKLDCPAPYYCSTNGTYFAWSDLEFDSQGTAHFAIASYHDHLEPVRPGGLYYGTWSENENAALWPVDVRSATFEANDGNGQPNQQDVGHSVQLVLRPDGDDGHTPALIYGVGNGDTFSSDSLGLHHDVDTLRYADLSNIGQPALTTLDTGMTHNQAPCCPTGRRFLDAAVDSDGKVHVAYNAGRNAVEANNNQDTRYLTVTDAGPTAPIVLSDVRMQDAQAYRPRIGLLNDGRTVIALLRIDSNAGASPGDVYEYIETDVGVGLFTEYMIAEDRSTNPTGVDVTVDRDGRIRVGYDVPRGAFDMLVLDDLAAGYSDAPSLLGDPVGSSGHFVRVAKDRDGKLHLAYVNQTNTGIVYARETDDGQWASQTITDGIAFDADWDIDNDGVEDAAKPSMMLELSVCNDEADCEDRDGGVQIMFAWGGNCVQTNGDYPQNHNYIWRNQGAGGVAEKIEAEYSGYALSGCQRWERAAIAHDGIGEVHYVWRREGGNQPGLIYGRQDVDGAQIDGVTQNLTQCADGANVFIRFDSKAENTPLIYCTSGSKVLELSIDADQVAYVSRDWTVDYGSQLLDVKLLGGDIADDAAGQTVPVFLWYSQGSLYVDRNGTATPTLVTTEFDYAEKNDFGALAYTPDGEVQIVYSRYRSTPTGGLTDYESRRLIDERVTDAVAVGQFLDATPTNAIRPGFGLLSDDFWAELVYFDLDDAVNQFRRRRFRSKRRPLLVNHRRDATLFLGLENDRDADGRLDAVDTGFFDQNADGNRSWSQRQAPENTESIDCSSIWDPLVNGDVVDFCQACQPGALDTDEDGILDGTGENPIDNCALVPNFDQADQDQDNIGDVCDDDRDGDGRENWLDGCPDVSNASPADIDFDGIEDSCDPSVTPPTCTDTNNGQSEPLAPNIVTIPGVELDRDSLTLTATIQLRGSNNFTPPCLNRLKGPDGHDRVFAFTPPVTGDWRFRAAGRRGEDPILALTDDCRQQDARYLACSDDAGAGLSAEITRRIEADETVFIVLDTYSPDAQITLQLNCLGCEVRPDSDNDGVPDDEDNCVDVPNPAPQLNRDGDALGDACDTMFDASVCDLVIPQCSRGQSCARTLSESPEIVSLTLPQSGKDDATLSCGPRNSQVPVDVIRFNVANAGEWTFRLQAQAMPSAVIARLDSCEAEASELSCNTFVKGRSSILKINAVQDEEILLAIGDYSGFGGAVELLATPPAVQGGDSNDAGCEATPELALNAAEQASGFERPLRQVGEPDTWSQFRCPGNGQTANIRWSPKTSTVFRFKPGRKGIWRIATVAQDDADFGIAYADSCLEAEADVLTCNDDSNLRSLDAAIDLELEADASAYFVVGSRNERTQSVQIFAQCLDCADADDRCAGNQDCGGGNRVCENGQCVEQNLNCQTVDAFCEALCGQQIWILGEGCDEPSCGCENSICMTDANCSGRGLSCSPNGRCISAENSMGIQCQDDPDCPSAYRCAANDATCHLDEDFCGAEICGAQEVCINDMCQPAPDCLGVPGGAAFIDNCGQCVGGRSGRVPCTQDCADVWGGSATADDCGVCDDNPANDNSSCLRDCAGVWNGEAVVDNCGRCAGGTSGQVACTQDCSDQWGGSAVEDMCGQCDSDPDNDCVQDCLGDWGGDAQLDDCGVCDKTPANDNQSCERDCAGQWDGLARIDQCGLCNDNPADDCTADCDDVFGGPAQLDFCNVCDANTRNDNLCARPCELGTTDANGQDGDLSHPSFAAQANKLYVFNSNTSGGAPRLNGENCSQGIETSESSDVAIRFVAPREGTWAFTLRQTTNKVLLKYNACPTLGAPQQTCAGLQNGRAIHSEPLIRGQIIYLAVDGIDSRGLARNGPFQLEARLISSCAGTDNLDAARDKCGVCDDDYTNDNTTCQQDCNGDWNGGATTDGCGQCVGGETGLSPCVQDCAGNWGGTATNDMCGVCDDDQTNDCTRDCNGNWGGTATLDECGVCDNDPNNDCVRCEGDTGCARGQSCVDGVCEDSSASCNGAIDLLSAEVVRNTRFRFTGNTAVNSGADHQATCATTRASSDDHFSFVVPASGTWTIRLTTNTSMVLSRLASCPASAQPQSIDCAVVRNGRAELKLVSAEAGTEVFFLVDGIDNRLAPQNGEYLLEAILTGR
ncbi:MAG: carboxypeptidase-like regulatory domain-containing protein [Myxococcota bacterium]|nr:carboxypeptidase-like regulatory domain-containing protein [Myxococcota bacterium]